jgi:hypothetical protein
MFLFYLSHFISEGLFVARAAAMSVFCLLYVYTPEIYPTIYRATALGIQFLYFQHVYTYVYTYNYNLYVFDYLCIISLHIYMFLSIFIFVH